MSTPSRSPKKLIDERRLLIRALLENFEKHGGRIVYPLFENEDTLLDALPVPNLIEVLKQSRYLDIGKLIGNDIISENGMGIREGMDPMDSDSTHELVLNVPELHISLDEHELQELSFMLFCLFCVGDQTHLITPMRRQLELSASCAEDIIKVTKRVHIIPEKPTTEMGAELLLQLLKEVRPSDFRKFRDFVKWRDIIARVLVQLMKESISQANLANTANPVDVPVLLANLKGAVRRLCFQEEHEFEEREYADAILCVISISQKMTPYSKSGFAFTWGLRIRLWETLLMALFEVLEDDIYIDDVEIVKTLLLEQLAPRLQISSPLHDACFSWVHFKQLHASMYPGMVPVLKNLMLTVNTNDPALEELDRIYVDEISRTCFASLTETLMDYHAKLPESQIMSGMVDLFLTFTESSRRDIHVPTIEDCISSSCRKVFQRTIDRQTPNETPHLQIKILAEETRELFETELLKYTGGLAPYCPSAAAVAAKTFHDAFGQELKPVLYELKAIPEDVVQMLKTADELEAFLFREIQHDANLAKSIVLWNVMDAISELLFSWIDLQLHKIKEWRERLCHEELWQPTSVATALSASAVEFKRLLEESIALVFSLNLNFSEDLVSKFIKGLADALKAYGKTTMNDIRGQEGIRLLIPSIPEPTRYKKELADAAAQKEERSMETKSLKRHSRLKSILGDPSLTTKMVPLVEDSENYQWFNNLKTNTLIVRINSIHFLKESIPELMALVERNYNNHGLQREDSMTRETLAEPLHEASVYLGQCVDIFRKFLGTKIVFWDGRVLWLEQLYRHHVSNSRMDFILTDLCKNLMDFNSVALESIRNELVHALLEACVEGLKRVLLDGGPYRLFKCSPQGNDLEMIEEDVKKLKELFNDAEEGLPMSLIEQTIKPVFEILDKMGLPTSELIQLAEETRKKSPGDLVYIKILGHRTDRAASKWLKKVMKTPKKVKPSLSFRRGNV